MIKLAEKFKVFSGTAMLFSLVFIPSSLTAAETVAVIPLYSPPAVTCTAQDEVVSANNRCWKDRNLGSHAIAASSSDSNGYGDYYQWGRLGDAHQNSNSITTTDTSSADVPSTVNFILKNSTPFDWRIPQNNGLWQGIDGTNNPCPQGFRIPTSAEWEAERASWSSNDAAGAYASPLKLPLAGWRSRSDGTFSAAGTQGYYWSSDIGSSDSTLSEALYLNADNAVLGHSNRASGYSVRCIKDRSR